VVIPANLDEQNNLVSFSSPEVSNYIILTAENITAVGLGDETLPSSFTLNQNYPNPFNPSTQISFALNSDSQITLDIFNILGQKVATLINEFRNAGTYSVNFDASNLTSGIYFYRLSNGQNTLVKKMNLIK